MGLGSCGDPSDANETGVGVDGAHAEDANLMGLFAKTKQKARWAYPGGKNCDCCPSNGSSWNPLFPERILTRNPLRIVKSFP